MNLKEAYHYSNFLQGLLTQGYSYILREDCSLTTTRTHLYSQLGSDQKDFEETPISPYNFSSTQIINLMFNIIREKEDLFVKISETKKKAEIEYNLNIDNALAANKNKRQLIDTLRQVLVYPRNKRKLQESTFKFNLEGNQIECFYDVIENKEFSFDEKDLKRRIKELLNETQKVSSVIDSIEINCMVDFVPKYDINADFEELL